MESDPNVPVAEAACDDAVVSAIPKKRGPKTPEGKARSSMNALKHGLRAEKFRLLPEETVEEFEAFAAEIKKDLKPRCAMERQFVEAIVIAFWREMRADRMEADVMSDMPPHCDDRVHGSNLIGKPENRMSMTTMLRYRAQASMDLKRALANLAAHRKARGSVPEQDCTNDLLPEVGPANQNYTNELSAAAESTSDNYTNELPAASEPVTQNCTNDFKPTPNVDAQNYTNEFIRHESTTVSAAT